MRELERRFPFVVGARQEQRLIQEAEGYNRMAGEYREQGEDYLHKAR